MMRDEEIQAALDRQPRGDPPSAETVDAGDGDRAAYAIVYAALAEDTGFAMPMDFAESIAAAAMPEPARPTVFERVILPILLLASAAIAVPTTVQQLSRAFRVLLGTPDGGMPPAAMAALVLLLVAAADLVIRKNNGLTRSQRR